MDAETWDSQPYWAQKIYLEGLFIERPWDIKLDLDPATWYSPLNDKWETFGNLSKSVEDKTIATSNDDDDDGESTDVEYDESWKRIPDIKDIGNLNIITVDKFGMDEQ